ncbi:DUF6261 family protein [Saccharicrinis aurantiacus]|uniref:DUF6261 family protein n=1 Tax=Saccharicrinis aurantiacus TaxID=1849719 RepID=UPI00249396BA|nr:DUF6261 family protein [Saccharicrinis aurantiacus]
MISKLKSHSRVTEVDATCKLIIEAYNKEDLSADTYITSVFDHLKTKSKALSNAIRQDKVESELDALDTVRDELVKSAHYLLIGYVRNPNQTYATAATAVKKVYDKYGIKMINESYAVQSSLSESLSADMARPEMLVHINTLPGVGEAFTALGTAQSNFSTAELKYKEERSKFDEKESATSIKKEVCHIINNDVVFYIGAMAKSNKAVYGNLALTVDKIIDTNNTTVMSRRKTKVEA